MIPALLALSAPVPGQKLAPMELLNPAGKPEVWRPGQETVVTFVAMWCDTWRVQQPRLEKMQKATTGVAYVTISVDGRYKDVPDAPAIWADPGGKIVKRLGIDRVPYTLTVAKEGTIRSAKSGIVRSSDVLQALRSTPAKGDVYLTFDDFPPKQGGEDLLDLLRREGVKATFFCIGTNAQARPDLVRRALKEGHSLQIHAWNHESPYDFPRCAEFLKTLGAEPHFVRSPGSEKIATLGGEKWDGPTIDPYDYRRPPVAELERRMLYGAKPGAAFQLHVGVQETVAALPKVIESLRERGFGFKSL